MTNKLLLVDDDEILLALLRSSLQPHGFNVSVGATAAEALHAAYQLHPDLIVVDMKLPDMDGAELCQRLRAITDVPIIILSGLNGEESIVTGLAAGADDYITKPYRIGELIARIRAQLRNSQEIQNTMPAMVLEMGMITVDVNRRKVTVRGEEVELTPIEFALLLCLGRNRNAVVSHRMLLSEVWGPECINQLEYLRLYIRYLRQKIEKDPSHPQIIRTERGMGYYLAA
ncbi:MAG: response regulator transcription factor [Caldilineaceae bacterium]|nr:response regulator transcription factor [Caldilineaceae bacterium]